MHHNLSRALLEHAVETKGRGYIFRPPTANFERVRVSDFISNKHTKQLPFLVQILTAVLVLTNSVTHCHFQFSLLGCRFETFLKDYLLNLQLMRTNDVPIHSRDHADLDIMMRCAAELLRILYFQKAYFRFSKWRPSAILDFYISAIFVRKIKFAPTSSSSYKMWWRSDDARPSYFVFSIFKNGRRQPSWIWYDVIAHHPRIVFDGLNILLKLHVHGVNILRDMVFLYLARLAWNCLFTPILGSIF